MINLVISNVDLVHRPQIINQIIFNKKPTEDMAGTKRADLSLASGSVWISCYKITHDAMASFSGRCLTWLSLQRILLIFHKSYKKIPNKTQ